MASVAASSLKVGRLRVRVHRGLMFLTPAVIVATWWVVSAGSTSPYFPPLSKTVASFVSFWLTPAGLTQLLASLQNFAVGLLIATVLGISVGVLLGSVRGILTMVSPVLEFIRATPAVVLVPIAIALFGIGSTTQVVVIASATVWPILLNTIDGVRGIDTVTRDVARSYRLTKPEQLFRVTLPASSPQIVAGMNVAVTVALVMIVFSEMQGATAGVGFTLLQQQRAFNMPGMWSTILLLGLLGFTLNLGFRGIEHRVLSWHKRMHTQQKG